jgi:mono/diheme cytochrome c family protein
MIKHGAVAIAVLAFVTGGLKSQAPTAASDATRQTSAVERGRYLTHEVAMCVQCHTPRDSNGNLIESKAFGGAPIPVTSPWPNREWAFSAPAIGGLPGFTDEQVVTLLITGRATGREPPKPPMPPFRLSREDAEAVVAYLRTITLQP